MLEPRFVQAHREAGWSIALTLLYLLGWFMTLCCTDEVTIGRTGLPQWFERGCLLLPLLFICFCIFLLCFFFHDCPLEE